MKSDALRLAQTDPLNTRASHPDEAYQRAVLPAVSRTFALTIPELPEGLAEVVTNGYLLCRIADTIEDDPGIVWDEKRRYHAELADLVEGRGDPCAFAAGLVPLLTRHTREAERALVSNAPRILRVTRAFDEPARAALARCVRIMCSGMPRFQRGRRGLGLEDVRELHEYCYHVAGVVGEMLTELFCEHSPRIAERRAELAERAVSFGSGLQLTNILKDIWEDLARGYCWLPRDVFRRNGFDLSELSPAQRAPAFEAGLGELIGIAHGHLRRALEFTLLIPREERGIRRFCLYALGMAVLTLQKIERGRGFGSAREVKISRRAVKVTVWTGRLAAGSERALRLLFSACAFGLPRPLSAGLGSLPVSELSELRGS